MPPAFAAATVSREGAAGRHWIDALPALVARLLQRWELTVDGTVRHGYVAVVVPVRTGGGEPAALKVGWRDPESTHEALALSTWAGRGAVRLLRADGDAGALLLERLDAGRDLHALAPEPATEAAGRLLRELHLPGATPLPTALPTLATLAARWAVELPERWGRLGEPLPRRAVDEAVATCRELGPGDPSGGPALLHTDLHYANVLAATRPAGPAWLAIDPKPLAGDPAYELVPLLRNRWSELVASGDPAGALRRRLAVAAEAAELDRERARRWAQARAVDDALWFLEHGRGEEAQVATAIAAGTGASATCC